MALTTEISPARPRFYYTVGDRKTMHMMLRDAEPLVPVLQGLDFAPAFSYDWPPRHGLVPAGLHRGRSLRGAGVLDALAEPVTIQADLLRLYWAHTGKGP